MSQKNKKLLLLLTIIMIVIFSVINGKIYRKKVNQNGRYGIFYVDDISHSRIGPTIKYHFFDNGIKVEDSYPCEGNAQVKKGDKYFGRYIPNSTDSFICCYCPIPSEFSNQPKDGWSSLPFEYCLENEDRCWTE